MLISMRNLLMHEIKIVELLLNMQAKCNCDMPLRILVTSLRKSSVKLGGVTHNQEFTSYFEDEDTKIRHNLVNCDLFLPL